MIESDASRKVQTFQEMKKEKKWPYVSFFTKYEEILLKHVFPFKGKKDINFFCTVSTLFKVEKRPKI